MPYIAGDGTVGQSITKMAIGNGAGASVPIVKVMAGNGSIDVEVWPGKIKFVDNFDRANETLGSSSGWTAIGTSPYFVQIVSNNAKAFDDTTDGSRNEIAIRNSDCATFIQYSKGKLINLGNAARGFWVEINANSANTDYVGVQWTGTSVQMFTCISGSVVQRGGTATATQVVGDTLEIRSSFSGGLYTYTSYINGVSKITWTDSTNLMPRTTHKRVGFGMQRNRASFTSTISTQFSEWEGGDF